LAESRETRKVHIVKTASVRDLRTRFPRIRALVEREGELVVTEHGRPRYILRPYTAPPSPNAVPIDYFARLKARQPRRLSAAASRALDEADRGER
jgi:hypothetical protein